MTQIEYLTRSHQYPDFDRHLYPARDIAEGDLIPSIFKFLSRLGTDEELHVDGDPTTDPSSNGHSDDKPDLRAVAAPQTLFNRSGESSESFTDFASRFPAAAWKSFSLKYYLQHDEGVLPRIAGLEQRCNDMRGLLSNQHKYPRRPWRSDLRAILPGLLVIDCFSRQVVAADPSCPYVALSYVWGPARVGGEKEGFRTDLRSHRLPRTIRDAMNVVRVLGMKYLWVDRYCINSTEPGTKHHTINNMDTIYEAANLTIIAACGGSGEHGLPSVSRTMKALDEDTTPPWNGIVYSEFSNPHLRQFQNSTYSTRGWTFQEDLLSQRRLIFTNDRATLYYEEDRISESSGIFAHINEYTQRRLTYPSDLLKAFLGVFRAYKRLRPPVKHVWGVPFLLDRGGNISHPGDGLLWRATKTCSLRRIKGLPSWTWAGWGSWSTHDTADGDIVSRESQSGPYRWLLDNVDLRRETRDWEPSDISLEVEAGAQLTDVSDHFRADHRRPPSVEGEELAPVLYLTAWSTTVNVRVSLTRRVHSADKDLKAAEFIVDPTPESLHNGGLLVNGQWNCQWTAAIICWSAEKGDTRHIRTQSLLLDRVEDDIFRRVGVLETDWHRSDLEEHECIDALDRSFARKRFRIE